MVQKSCNCIHVFVCVCVHMLVCTVKYLIIHLLRSVPPMAALLIAGLANHPQHIFL